jgi:aryl-phospho-beta-D-glucosidase BglC (GH1 family)
MSQINRRSFIKTVSTGATMLGIANLSQANFIEDFSVVKNKLPRWRGFNILKFFRSFFYDGFNPLPYDDVEQDFKWISDWGFDFVRLPLSYPYYVNFNSYGSRPMTAEESVNFNEEAIETIEQVVYLAHKYKLHVSLNLHRAPGYCINNENTKEPFNLWTDETALQAFCAHWEMWAKRFKNVSPELLSFDLVNEPRVPGDIYRKIAIASLEAIHRHNPKRIVIADGNNGGKIVIPELTDLNISQSCRAYEPGKLTHFRNPWGGDIHDTEIPVWPGLIDGKEYNKKIMEEYYRPWIDLVKQGVGVHCGECGCYNRTPHDVFLAWFTDILDILTPNGIGWAMWNFRGSFGVLDSGLKDVVYENWHGHQLDSKLLTLLQKH